MECALLACGCANSTKGNGVWARPDDARTVHAPKTDRCENFSSAPGTYKECQKFKQSAVDYLHGLNTGTGR